MASNLRIMSELNKQVEKFHEQIVTLIKKYQFRDRNQIICCGVSVSQCYILEALFTDGALTMNELADKMHLQISTVTRVVEQLVLKGFVIRTEDADDRRKRTITLTTSGESMYQDIWQSLYQSELTILQQFPEEHRPMLIDFLKKLNQAVDHWQSCCEPIKDETSKEKLL